MLHFAGIKDYFDKHSDTAWNDDADRKFAGKFDYYSERAMVAFADNYENRVNDIDHCFERAVLTKGDYLTNSKHSRWNMLSTAMVKNNIKRDHSWKHVLRLTDDNEFLYRQSLVKELFDDKAFDPKNPVKTLTSICDTATPTGDTWRDLLIKYPQIMGYSQQGFIGFYENCEDVQPDSIGIIPFYQLQTNHRHLELFTFALGIELGVGHIAGNYDFKPFEYAQLIEQKVNNEIPFLHLVGYTPFTKSYNLAICARINAGVNAGVNAQLPDKWELNHYEFCVSISTATGLPEEYDDGVAEILSSRGYRWRECDFPGYYLEVSPTLEAAKTEISELLEALKSLKEEEN